MRFVITLAATLSCALSSAMAEPEGPLTWDIIRSGVEYYPFEEELNACIAEDIGRRGIGEACIHIPQRHCPESVYPDDPPGKIVREWCLGYLKEYWSNRMDKAYTALLAAYRERDDDREDEDKRAPKLEVYQDLWETWRDTDCDFVYVGQHHYPWISVEYSSCKYGATARRAVGLEGWLRAVEYLELTDHRR
jgi:uncharacterized protein YecT (DUF1311 family)